MNAFDRRSILIEIRAIDRDTSLTSDFVNERVKGGGAGFKKYPPGWRERERHTGNAGAAESIPEEMRVPCENDQ